MILYTQYCPLDVFYILVNSIACTVSSYEFLICLFVFCFYLGGGGGWDGAGGQSFAEFISLQLVQGSSSSFLVLVCTRTNNLTGISTSPDITTVFPARWHDELIKIERKLRR